MLITQISTDKVSRNTALFFCIYSLLFYIIHTVHILRINTSTNKINVMNFILLRAFVRGCIG
jgi:hypothetical protein